jgi:hypothetical protein
LECTIRVAPFRWWRRRSLIAIVVVAVVVVLATSIVTPIISAVTALVITVITRAVVTPVIAVVATIVVAPIIAAIIASIPVVIATIGPMVTVIKSIRTTVTVVEALVTVPVVVVAALCLLGLEGYSEGTLQLLSLPDGVFRVAVELALVVHDHVEVIFEEGGRSWWIYHVGFARLLARPISSVIVIFTVEVVHCRILSVD